MLKYQHIIDSLTEKQKIMLLADINCLSEFEYSALGVPTVKFGEFRAFCKERYPSPVSLANSFDNSLIADVCDDVYDMMIHDGVNCATVPSPKLKINPCRYALSEDPYVCNKMSGEYIAAAKESQMAACLPDFSIRDDESYWLDKIPDERMIAEYVIKPHREATDGGGVFGAFTEAGNIISEYDELNQKLSDVVKDAYYINCNGFSIRRNIHPEDTVKYILRGEICIGGSPAMIKTALNKYEKIKRAIPNGRATVDELEREVQRGNAISMEIINEAVDRIIGFAHACNTKKDLIAKYDSEKRAELAYRASCESAVLLKNDGKILPYTHKKRKISLIGDIIVNYDGDGVCSELEGEYAERIQGYGYKYLGFGRGYDMETDRDSEDMCPNSLLKDADLCIVFVGTNPEKEKYITRSEHITLPANQIAMLDKLQWYGNKIVVVMSSDYTMEMDFADNVAGIILAPLNTKEGVMAAIDMVLGKACPSGKLSSSLYFDTKNLLLKQKAYRNTFNMSTGCFIGYRYYDTAEYSLGYSFGHGLSYTKFSYSHFSLVGNKLTFTVKNTGKFRGGEVVQIYMGIKDSAVLVPKRELVDYKKVMLNPGEKATLSFEINPPEIYDTKNKEYVTQKGEYTLYVASSLDNIKYQKRIVMGDRNLEPDNKKLSDYLQSYTNIIDDKYTLEANYKLMKKNIRNIIFGVGSMLLAIILFIFAALSDASAKVPTVISIILAFASMACFALEFYDRKIAQEEERKLIDEANREQFEDAEYIDVYSAERMFIEEFDKADALVEDRTVHSLKEDENDYFIHVNKELTFAEACADFDTFATEKGFKFSSDTIREIFASIASSRIIIMKDMSDEQFKTVVMLLCEYFECPVSIDYVSQRYVNEESLLFKDGDEGQRIKTNILKGMENAYNEKQNVQILALGEVGLADISNYFVSFARYARNPSGSVSIEARNEKNIDVTYVIPQNTWMILNLKSGEKVTDIPEYMIDISTVAKFEYNKCPMAEIRGDVRKFKFYQLGYLLDKCKNVYEFSEDVWKKIDKLTEYAKNHGTFYMGNKLCTGIEKYSSAFIACEGEVSIALDKAMAAKLIPSIIIAIGKNENADIKELSETLDTIFGEENTMACRNAISTSGGNN